MHAQSLRASGCREGCTDSISLRPLGWSAPPWHAASDGAGCTAELGFGAPGPRHSVYSQVHPALTGSRPWSPKHLIARLGQWRRTARRQHRATPCN